MTKNILLKAKQEEFRKFASSSIIEEANGTYSLSKADTAASILIALSLNKDNILKDDKVSKILPELEECYYFNTSLINTFIDNLRGKLNFNSNCREGNSGNLSLAFFSYEKDKKLLTSHHYEIIKKCNIKVIFTHKENNDFYYLDILNINDWKLFTDNIGKIIPKRICLENISFYECSIFYLKPLNAKINLLIDQEEEIKNGEIFKEKGLIENFRISNNLEKMNSKVIKEKFGFNIGDYLYDISNNNFLIKQNNGNLEKIYAIEKTHLYFPVAYDKYLYINDDSFLKKEFAFKKKTDIIEIIDPLTLYKNEKEPKSNLNNIKFFIKNEYGNFMKIIEGYDKSNEVLLNKIDDSYKNKLEKLKSQYFDVNKTEDNNLVIRIKDFNSSKINITIHDRYGGKQNNSNIITWFSIFRDRLSFEREKTLSIFFIEKFIKNILKLGHTDISIDLEMPVIKTSGNNGFIDLFIRSKYNGFNYGQFFELKAVYNFTEKLVNEATEQAQSYVITEYLDKYNINNSYSGYNFFETKMINLLDKKEQD